MTNIKRMSEQDLQKCVDLLNKIDELMKSEEAVRYALNCNDAWSPIREDAFDIMADGILMYMTDCSFRTLYNMHKEGAQSIIPRFGHDKYASNGFTMDIVRELIFFRRQEMSKEEVVRLIEEIIAYHLYTMDFSEYLSFGEWGSGEDKIITKIEPPVDDFDLFEEFLVKEGIFEIFFTRDMDDDLYRIYYKDSNSYIFNAFYWDDQPEGPEYWEEIDDNWRNFLEEKKMV